MPCRARRSFDDERRLQPANAGARGRVRLGGAEGRHGRPEGPSLGRRHSRFDLQRGSPRMGPLARPIHERFSQGCVMAKVLVSDSLSKEGLEFLKQAKGIELENKPGLNEEDLAKALAGVEGLVIRSGSKVTAKVIEAADKLRDIGRAGIGIDNVDVKAASRRGIIVMNTPTGNAVTTAEHALGLLFSVARKIPQASQTMKEGKWE